MDFYKRYKKAQELYSILGDISQVGGALEKTDGGYYYANDDIEVQTEFSVHDSTGIVKRRDTVTNISERDITLDKLGIRFTFSDKESGKLTVKSSQELRAAVKDACSGDNGSRIESTILPLGAIYDEKIGQGMAFFILANTARGFKAKEIYTETERQITLEAELLPSEDASEYRLEQGKSLRFPNVLFYQLESTSDADACKLLAYYNEVCSS